MNLSHTDDIEKSHGENKSEYKTEHVILFQWWIENPQMDVYAIKRTGNKYIKYSEWSLTGRNKVDFITYYFLKNHSKYYLSEPTNK